ncbi:hypothetical protein AB0B15_02945 [Streptomyces sp. NPDC045456]|uniref:hypothetical protein n=1 Tax=Streptomyces sp. NPDC045456 TaxID=3155254 RepID=UPI0033C29EE5
MRCSTVQSTVSPGDEPCQGTATHLLIGSIHTDESSREPFRDPVCKPCGESYTRRPALKARIVPLHVYVPTPEFTEIAGGHRLIDHPFHEAACHDCLLLGSIEYFRQGRDKGLHGCRFRPESVNSRTMPRAGIGPDTTLDELASRWRKYVTYDIGMAIGDWHPLRDNPHFAATFTSRDREYGLRHSQGGTYVWAEKLENRGRPAPERINPQDAETFTQAVFHFYDLVNRYEATYFATYTPGREDVILHAPEGSVSAVLRLTGLTRPGNPLAEVTDAVCDAFGAIADITFQTRIYE